jgi:dipeptidyl aminopeptidase/acylaminoacyl peptidase
VIYEQYDEQSKTHLWATSVEDPSQSIALTSGQASEEDGRVSPDGRWLAFESDRAGRREVFVQRFPEATQVFKVSRSGGRAVRWADDGERLYYRRGSEILEVNFREEGGRFVVESETPVLELPPFSGSYDVAPDGRFVVVSRTEEANTELKVVTNWFGELERIAPTGKGK